MPQAAGPIAGISGIMDILGSLQNSNRQNDMYNSAMNAQNQGLAIQNALAMPQINALNQASSLAANYNPAQEAQAGVARAGQVFKNSAQSALGNVASSFANAGSPAGNSSEYGVRSQDTLNRVSDPFQSYLADVYSNPTQKRMEMWQPILHGPSGSLADNYFRASGQDMSMMGGFPTDYSSGLGMLSQGLGSLFGGGGGGGGNGLAGMLGGYASVPGRSG